MYRKHEYIQKLSTPRGFALLLAAKVTKKLPGVRKSKVITKKWIGEIAFRDLRKPPPPAAAGTSP